MKIRCLLFLGIFLFCGGKINAQPDNCEQLVQLGDTLICRHFAGKSKLQYKEDFYLNGTRIFTRWWHRRKHGEIEWTQRQSKGPFAKRNGPAALYFPNGSLKAYSFFEHDKKVGPCKEYDQKGTLVLTCDKGIHQKGSGYQTFYHENGEIKAKTRFENGRMNEILIYQDEQGNTLPVGTFKDGNGTWIWVEKGKPTTIYTYKNGRETKKKTQKQ